MTVLYKSDKRTYEADFAKFKMKNSASFCPSAEDESFGFITIPDGMDVEHPSIGAEGWCIWHHDNKYYRGLIIGVKEKRKRKSINNNKGKIMAARQDLKMFRGSRNLTWPCVEITVVKITIYILITIVEEICLACF